MKTSLFTSAVVAVLAAGLSFNVQALSLADAQRLALQEQAQLTALAAEVRAARADAVAAAQLPDPSLSLGLINLPFDNADPWSADAERMTMSRIGLMQRVVRGDKRRLAAERDRRMADLSEARLAAQRAAIRRQSGEAWAALWRARGLQRLREDELALSRLQQQQMRIAAANAAADQQAQLQRQLATAMAEGRQIRAEADAQAARWQLARWFELPTELALPVDLEERQAPVLHVLMDAAPAHPWVRMAAQQQSLASTVLAQAEASRQADWWVEAMVGHRPQYRDLISLNLGMDLPLFTAQRQDRRAEAARERLLAAEQRHADALTALKVRMADAHQRWLADEQQLTTIRQALTLAEAAARSAEGRYANASIELERLLMARQQVLQLREQWIEQSHRLLLSQLQLQELDARESDA